MDRSLFELQEADNAVARLKRERFKLDDGTAARARRESLHTARDRGTVKLRQATALRTEQEDELAATEAKIERSQKRMMSATSAHEISALDRDIKGLSARRGESDERVLVLMEETELATAELTAQQAALDEAEAEVATIEAQFKKQAARLDREIKAAAAQREQQAALVNPASLKKYDDLAKRFHGVAVAHVDKGNCSACGMAFTIHNLREAKSMEWPTCENCMRLLFIE